MARFRIVGYYPNFLNIRSSVVEKRAVRTALGGQGGNLKGDG